ncbi:hypothetical protein [Cyanobium sp. ATX 6A2]|uniref:hypothetical protein n=1 Tax=Cyanobium sp. ATX 6A2 TaxID=2823700 RepID=UPI0020CE8516|nr:hypothetical protein [Cyanobium sp. ATX 6A2]
MVMSLAGFLIQCVTVAIRSPAALHLAHRCGREIGEGGADQTGLDHDHVQPEGFQFQQQRVTQRPAIEGLEDGPPFGPLLTLQ